RAAPAARSATAPTPPLVTAAGVPTTTHRSKEPFLERFLASDELADYRLRPQGKSAPFKVGSFHGPNVKRVRSPQELRTLIYSGGVAASLTAPQVAPGIYGPRATIGDLVMRDVLNVGTTTADAITYIRENVFTNAAAPVAEAIDLTTGLTPASALTFTEATAPVVTIAHWIPITRQAVDDAGQLRSYIEGRLINGLERSEARRVGQECRSLWA